MRVMRYLINRRVHPVGQGQCISEFHSKDKLPFAKFFFDCGALRNANKNELNHITQAEPSGGDKYLFITHFHYDHINHIPALLKSGRPFKRIFIPELSDRHHVLAIMDVVYNSSSFADVDPGLLSVASGSFTSFGDVQVTKIMPDKKEGPIPVDDIEIIDMESTGNEINSGTVLRVPNPKSEILWVYIPVNKPLEINDKKYSKIKKVLVSILGPDRIAKSKLADLDLSEELCEYIKKSPSNFKSIKEEVTKLYRNISSDLNETSLVIYSGPRDKESDRDLIYGYRNSFPFNWRRRHHNVELLVTGDFPFSKIGYVKKRLENFLPLVGVAQIPHHGSGKKFGSPITDNAEFAFVQYGTRNTYKHPDYDVINAYKSYGMKVLKVTEYKYTRFNEIIRIT